jgi:hypothetical protein
VNYIKTPIKAIPWISYTAIVDADNIHIASIHQSNFGPDYQQAAAEIVQDVNAFDDVIDALKAWMDFMGAPPVDQHSYDSAWENAWNKSKVALAKLEE